MCLCNGSQFHVDIIGSINMHVFINYTRYVHKHKFGTNIYIYIDAHLRAHTFSYMNRKCCHQKKKKKIKVCKKSTTINVSSAHVYGHVWLKPRLRKHQQTCRKTEIHNRERGSYLSNEHSVAQWSSDKSSWECRVPDKHCIRQTEISLASTK